MRKPPVGKVGSPPFGSRREVEIHVIHFVRDSLAAWRNGLPASISREKAREKKLNGDLCRFLSNASHLNEELFSFQHEVSQKGRRSVDFAANPVGEFLAAVGYFSFRDNIIVFEAKRLPAPTLKRKLEYVTGGTNITGGIQRYKTGDHGGEHAIAGIIGYIQKRDIAFFYEEINSWITEFAVKSPDDLAWSRCERLCLLDMRPDHTAHLRSSHARINNASIELHHLWVMLLPNSGHE